MAEEGTTGADGTTVPGAPRPSAERRWPMAAAVLAAALMQVVVPNRGRVAVWWLFPVAEVGILALVIAADPGRIDRRSETSRILTICLIAVMTLANTAGAIVLMYDIVAGVKGMTATVLLGRGAQVWVTNVIVFSLWFWELDRGGPAERAARSRIRPSFAFPEDTLPELAPEGWEPTYPDYLYLSFTNSTAFSP